MRRTDQLDSQILFDYTWNKKETKYMIWQKIYHYQENIWYNKYISNKTYRLLPVISVILNVKENLIVAKIFDWKIVCSVQIGIVYIFEFNYV